MPFGTSTIAAEVIEDRGDLGIGGRQIVRIRYVLEPDVVCETEWPAEELLPPPDPSGPPSARRRRVAPA
jgi:hypothetical protein